MCDFSNCRQKILCMPVIIKVRTFSFILVGDIMRGVVLQQVAIAVYQFTHRHDLHLVLLVLCTIHRRTATQEAEVVLELVPR